MVTAPQTADLLAGTDPSPSPRLPAGTGTRLDAERVAAMTGKLLP